VLRSLRNVKQRAVNQNQIQALVQMKNKRRQRKRLLRRNQQRRRLP
jgi:hypothetical protein